MFHTLAIQSEQVTRTNLFVITTTFFKRILSRGADHFYESEGLCHDNDAEITEEKTDKWSLHTTQLLRIQQENGPGAGNDGQTRDPENDHFYADLHDNLPPDQSTGRQLFFFGKLGPPFISCFAPTAYQSMKFDASRIRMLLFQRNRTITGGYYALTLKNRIRNCRSSRTGTPAVSHLVRRIRRPELGS